MIRIFTFSSSHSLNIKQTNKKILNDKTLGSHFESLLRITKGNVFFS